MKRFIIVSISLMLSAIAVSASDKANDFKYYHRGVFVSLDFAPERHSIPELLIEKEMLLLVRM